MKTLGLIGGISWVSTLEYYRLISEGIHAELGGLNFGRCVIWSFNYADIKCKEDSNDWDATLQMLTEASLHLKSCGAEAIVLCCNTMHLLATPLEQAVGLPLLHIAEVTAAEVARQGLSLVALLGTRFTMEQAFFREKLAVHGIEALIPKDADRGFIHEVIFEELSRGIICQETKARFLSIIAGLVAQGAQGVILGCTEIPLLIQAQDVAVPVFDTTAIHARAAVAFSLKEHHLST